MSVVPGVKTLSPSFSPSLYFFLSLFLSIFFKAFLVSEIVLFLRLGRDLPGEHRCLEQLAAATGFAAGP